MKTTILLLLAVILVAFHSTDAGFQSRSSYRTGSTSKNIKSDYNIESAVGRGRNAKSLESENLGGKSNKSSGISAWGIIGLIVAAIMLATSGYYAFVFYPLLCKKERNYDMIELTNVV